MNLPFLDRREELRRLRTALGAPQGHLVCLYGRRRCGKSRLLQEALGRRPAVYFVCDERESALQRDGLASAIAGLIPGFDGVRYPDWEALLERWVQAAPAGAVLALDEFPSLVSSASELPSLLQKRIDRPRSEPLHWALCGSSQRMMHGLVLDASAPLYGRAREILNVRPLPAGWISQALRLRGARGPLEAFSVWGGVPRYWELAADYRDTWAALRDLVLDPLGPLHGEPVRLLRDEMREITQVASVMALVGRGCHRASELARRLEKPLTALSRPLERLVDLGFLKREMPFGVSARDTTRTLYRIADPFLRFWFRFVEPNRSLLEARRIDVVERQVRAGFPNHEGEIWEDLARAGLPYLEIAGRRWGPAARWWGAGADRRPLEIDIVAESHDGRALLIGEAKLRVPPRERSKSLAGLRDKVGRFELARGREVVACLFDATGRAREDSPAVINAGQVLAALR